MMDYQVVIGLETHVELNTNTKVFCGCKNEFGGVPNSHCCPVCTGMPGSLPRLNKAAVEKAVMAGLVTNCTINREFGFERKNYYYPDLPKAYQVSQSSRPICIDGFVEVKDAKGNNKKIRINRIHLEEDAGKLIHSDFGETYVDYNRGGVPLIETVSEPDLSSAEEALEYLNFLRDTFKYIGITDGKMEQGSLRCDVNISLMPVGSKTYGNRTEMKNLNSFKAIERAIKYEVARQKEVLNSGGRIKQSTLRWDDEEGKNYPMRSKEDAQDYRYFPEPDILFTKITEEQIEEIRAQIPVLPKEIKNNLMTEYGLGDYDAELISKDKVISDFFFETSKNYKNYKKLTNWITSEISRRLNLVVSDETIIPIKADDLAYMLNIFDKGEVSQLGARTIFEILWENPGKYTVDQIITENSLKLDTNDGELESVIKQIIADNPKAVADYQGGNQKTFAFFIGNTMRAVKGQADAGKVSEILRRLLDK